MLATITGLIATGIPLVTKSVESWFSKKQRQEDQKFELEKIRITAEAAANADSVKAQAEMMRAEADVEIQRLKVLKDQQNKPTGYKWIDASVNLVRALFGYAAIIIFVASGVNLWLGKSPLLTQEQFSEILFSVVFYFFAERSVKKAFGKD